MIESKRKGVHAGLQPWATEPATELKQPTDRHWVSWPISTIVEKINSQSGYVNIMHQLRNPVYSGA